MKGTKVFYMSPLSYRANSAGSFVSKVLALALVTACNTCRSAQRAVRILFGG